MKPFLPESEEGKAYFAWMERFHQSVLDAPDQETRLAHLAAEVQRLACDCSGNNLDDAMKLVDEFSNSIKRRVRQFCTRQFEPPIKNEWASWL